MNLRSRTVPATTPRPRAAADLQTCATEHYHHHQQQQQATGGPPAPPPPPAEREEDDIFRPCKRQRRGEKVRGRRLPIPIPPPLPHEQRQTHQLLQWCAKFGFQGYQQLAPLALRVFVASRMHAARVVQRWVRSLLARWGSYQIMNSTGFSTLEPPGADAYPLFWIRSRESRQRFWFDATDLLRWVFVSGHDFVNPFNRVPLSGAEIRRLHRTHICAVNTTPQKHIQVTMSPGVVHLVAGVRDIAAFHHEYVQRFRAQQERDRTRSWLHHQASESARTMLALCDDFGGLIDTPDPVVAALRDHHFPHFLDRYVEFHQCDEIEAALLVREVIATVRQRIHRIHQENEEDQEGRGGARPTTTAMTYLFLCQVFAMLQHRFPFAVNQVSVRPVRSPLPAQRVPALLLPPLPPPAAAPHAASWRARGVVVAAGAGTGAGPAAANLAPAAAAAPPARRRVVIVRRRPPLAAAASPVAPPAPPAAVDQDLDFEEEDDELGGSSSSDESSASESDEEHLPPAGRTPRVRPVLQESGGSWGDAGAPPGEPASGRGEGSGAGSLAFATVAVADRKAPVVLGNPTFGFSSGGGAGGGGGGAPARLTQPLFIQNLWNNIGGAPRLLFPGS